jgi:hypothetical protein
MSQHIKILKILEDQDWHCTNEFYAAYIADPRTRICELKKEGYDLSWRWCQRHDHKRSKEWKLNVVQSQNQTSRQTIQPVHPSKGQNAVPVQFQMHEGHRWVPDFTLPETPKGISEIRPTERGLVLF